MSQEWGDILPRDILPRDISPHDILPLVFYFVLHLWREGIKCRKYDILPLVFTLWVHGVNLAGIPLFMMEWTLSVIYKTVSWFYQHRKMDKDSEIV